ncbi:hypothetical protein FocTR4_00010980 [Fusarium oxysporum f. sp. cubense]|uniref:Uncharacterized protein n=1 Tax=Fusarium oxysporum f. sp. cubense TaxID=61366 RepID=A0A5C6SE13_FUSOC|nr:hypothetical protein FocTR4_00010980 [Fusarium oxysporum f. sp. cubense]
MRLYRLTVRKSGGGGNYTSLRKKLTRAQKAASRYEEYKKSLIAGLFAAIVGLGLSAAVIAKVPGNAAMIWHLCLVTSVSFVNKWQQADTIR